MKRKLMRHGNASLTIAIPMKWIKEHSLNKGDELEVKETKDSISISTEKYLSDESIEIDISGYGSITHRVLSAIYKAGFDKLEIIFSNAEESEIAQDTINNEFIGFEITKVSKKRIVAEKLTILDHKGIQSIINRTFNFIIYMSQETINQLQKPDDDEIKKIIAMDKNVNKLTDYCRRAINKKVDDLYKRNAPVYFIIEELEKIGDVFKYICQNLEKNPKKAEKDLIEIFKQIHDLLLKSYELFNSFSMEKMKTFKQTKEEIEIKMNKLKVKDVKTFVYLSILLDHIFDLNGPIMAMSFK